jgi:hypothetical protein
MAAERLFLRVDRSEIDLLIAEFVARCRDLGFVEVERRIGSSINFGQLLRAEIIGNKAGLRIVATEKFEQILAELWK